ncbi:phasin family protein [Microvirga sp. VF16]|uniref:phasin family protein n=1 Tax=Microvirga sp. VF16 TaxID=2807101 RepID=UPI00193D91CF|nr:phasin family protein [Microvirga sp. VF16]QRM32466.1 phasin family protein [Microvirga sp. VF16]
MMATSGRFSQTPPDKVNEFFDKLLATSDNAVKTRERLFGDLKEELELLAILHEQHLFPVLRRHGMDDLLRDATSDNAETSALLADLERMPKNSSEFLGHLAELKRVFQQHIRDDKKELLPAVLKVLSDEEAKAVVEQVEDDMAGSDETKRAEARSSREQGEAVRQVTDDVAETMRAGIEGAQTLVRTMQEVVENSFGTVSEVARRSTNQTLRLFGLPNGDAHDLTGQTSENLRAVAQSGTALARGVQGISHEWLERSAKRLQRNLDGFDQLARCRSVTDLIATQSSLIRDNLEQTLETSRRMAELTIQVADEATRTVTMRAEQTAQRFSRVA